MNEIYYLITINGEYWTGAWSYKNASYSFRTTLDEELAKKFYDLESVDGDVEWILRCLKNCKKTIQKTYVIDTILVTPDLPKKSELPMPKFECSSEEPKNFCRPTINENDYVDSYNYLNPDYRNSRLKTITEICKLADEYEGNYHELSKIRKYIIENKKKYSLINLYFMIEFLDEKLERIRYKEIQFRIE